MKNAIRKFKTYKSFYISYIIVIFLISFLVYYTSFYLTNQIFFTKHYLNNFTKNYVYSYNIKDYNFEDLDSDNINSASFYKFEYKMIENKLSLVLFFNKNAIENGVPFFIDDNLFFAKLLNNRIESNTMYTHKKNLINNNIHYLNYIDEEDLRKNIFSYEFQIADYIILHDDLSINASNADISIFKDSKLLTNYYDFNVFKNNSFMAFGEQLKSHSASKYTFLMTITYLLLLIPLLSATFIFYNFYLYFINRQKNFILIELIYGKEVKKASSEHQKNIIIISYIPMFCATITAYFFINTKILYLFVGILIGILYSYVISKIIIKKLLEKIFYSESWSINHD